MKYLIIAVATLIFTIIQEVQVRIQARRDCSKKSIIDIAFMNQRKEGLLDSYNVPGAYIITNVSNGRSYVGQSIKIVDRVNAHLTGAGNGDVYADFRNGDRFAIELVPLSDTSYKNLNALERVLIKARNSYEGGYNKTRGNA